jgi:glutamate/tyrosine decarboxylase-like PLP-dependent enzyme
MSEEKLFPDESSRNTIEQFLLERLRIARNRVLTGSVSPNFALETFQAALKSKNFQRPENMQELLEWVISSMETGIVHPTHPRYFGLFNPQPTFPAICADMIAADFNPQICVWSHAPVAVEIENHVIGKIAERAGLPVNSRGHFTSGGSEANCTAVVCALTSANTEFAQMGARAFEGQPKIYVSRESHLAWFKIAHQLGIGRNAVCLVPTDGLGRMDTTLLHQQLQNDLSNGEVPVLIAATAGTTNAGMVDPLFESAEVAKHYGLWYHVDAAWGGALIASPKYRVELDGIERADSITIDAHKWFSTTMGAGIFVTRRAAVLAEAFSVSTDYMPSNDASVDPYVTSIQWSRRFVGLRLFLALGAAGWEGYARHVEHAIKMINRLINKLTAAGWAVVNDSRMAVACLVPPDSSIPVNELVDRVVASGNSWVSMTRFEGQAVVRACATNGTLTEPDVDQLVAELIHYAMGAEAPPKKRG